MDGARKALILLLAAAAVPAVAQTIAFVPRAACFSDGAAVYRLVPGAGGADHVVQIDRDAAVADIRIALIDTAEAADFVLVDDGDGGPACGRAARTIALGPAARLADVKVGLMSAGEAADYRIFVRSERFSPAAAVALFAVMRRGTAPGAGRPLTRLLRDHALAFRQP
jgi:hypothetical protein